MIIFNSYVKLPEGILYLWGIFKINIENTRNEIMHI